MEVNAEIIAAPLPRVGLSGVARSLRAARSALLCWCAFVVCSAAILPPVRRPFGSPRLRRSFFLALCVGCSLVVLAFPLCGVPKGGSRLNRPKMINIQDVEKIMLHLEGQDKLIFRLCVESGLRISDALNLRAWYLDRVIYVKEQKTGKERIITLSEGLYALLEPIKVQAVKYSDKKRYAFPGTKYGKPVHRATYHRHLKRVCQNLGIDFSAHSTRKLFAWELLKSTKDIFEVQKALNHKYVADTCGYLDIDYAEMIKSATNVILSQKQ
jgi:integrase